MLINYSGILLYSKVYKDNDLYVKFLSNTDEVISGIVYGGLSKKKRNIFQIGFYLNFEVSQKLNKPCSINAELSEPFVSIIMHDKYKLSCLMCVTSLINISIIEGQKLENIYNTSNTFLLKMLYNKKWFRDYCIFLFKLLKIIGYEIDYSANTLYKYFDLEDLVFIKRKSFSSIEFPFTLLNDNKIKLSIDDVSKIFQVFEIVFLKNHLSNFNLKLPNQYHLFKKLIIERISKK